MKRYALYPFDNRWCYHSSVPLLWNRPRPELIAQRAEGEPFLIVRRFAERPKEGRPAFFTSALPDYHLLRPNVVAIPLRLGTAPAEVSPQTTGQGSVFEHLHDSKHASANLSQSARAYLSALTKLNPDQNEELGRAIWFCVRSRGLAACPAARLPGNSPALSAIGSHRRAIARRREARPGRHDWQA